MKFVQVFIKWKNVYILGSKRDYGWISEIRDARDCFVIGGVADKMGYIKVFLVFTVNLLQDRGFTPCTHVLGTAAAGNVSGHNDDS